MANDYAALRTELALARYAGLSDAAAAADLARPGAARAVPMRVGDFANWLAARGLLRKVNDARTHASEYVASAALLLMWKIQGDPGREVDPADPGVQGMFGAFVAAGIVAADDVTAFDAACTATDPHYFSFGWAVPPAAADVAHARAM